MGLMDILNQAADALNQINASAQNGNSFADQDSVGSTIGGALANWAASVKNKYADTAQQIAFTKYINSFANSGSDLGQDERLGLIKQALEHCGASTTPDTTLGEIYPYVVKMTDENLSNSKLPTAHSTCPKVCLKSREKCEDCLKKRLAILEALYYVDRPEEYKNKVSAAAKKPQRQGESKCTLCGAHVNPSIKTCEYCGTPVSGVFDGGEPDFLSAAQIVPPEQTAYDLLYQYQLEEIELTYTPEFMKMNINLHWATTAERRQSIDIEYANHNKDGLWEKIKKESEEKINNHINALKVKMTMSDIYYMADMYHLSVGQYLRGLFENDPHLTTAPAYREAERQDLEDSRQREERRQNHELNMQRLERRRKLNQEEWKRRQESYRAPQYSGGGGGSSSKCCGNCKHFIAADTRCAIRSSDYWQPSSASDDCNQYVPK